MKINDFARENSLELKIFERGILINRDPKMKFYARFLDVWIKNGYALHGAYGDGETPDKAIIDYCKRISLKTLVFAPDMPDRREIKSPELESGVTLS